MISREMKCYDASYPITDRDERRRNVEPNLKYDAYMKSMQPLESSSSGSSSFTEILGLPDKETNQTIVRY